MEDEQRSHCSSNNHNCIGQGILPDKPKIASVIPLHKGGDINDPNNYHSTSILPTLQRTKFTKTRDVCKTLCPLKIFLGQFKMYEEEIHFGKLSLEQYETVLTHLTLTVTWNFDPNINRIPLLPRTDVRTKFEEDRSSY